MQQVLSISFFCSMDFFNKKYFLNIYFFNFYSRIIKSLSTEKQIIKVDKSLIDNTMSWRGTELRGHEGNLSGV